VNLRVRAKRVVVRWAQPAERVERGMAGGTHGVQVSGSCRCVCVCLCVVLKERESRQGSTAAYLYRAWARVGSSIRLYVYGL